MRYAWLTDIHLDFLQDKKAVAFVEKLATLELEGLFLTGDISTAGRLEFHLGLFEDGYQAPVYFVLGNHDYYGGSIESVRRMVRKLCGRCNWLHWLPESGIVDISRNTCLLGHGSWADGRLGDYNTSRVKLNDYVQIQNFVKAGEVGRLALLNSLGDQAAAYFEDILPEALEHYQHVIVLTHVPPFKESCWHEGEIAAEDWLPHFSCKAVGTVLRKFMSTFPDRRMTVLCGHTHSSGQVTILPNLVVKTGEAEYGLPRIQEILENN